jgi:hypothetical protein
MTMIISCFDCLAFVNVSSNAHTILRSSNKPKIVGSIIDLHDNISLNLINYDIKDWAHKSKFHLSYSFLL